jgi:hypothetical protein
MFLRQRCLRRELILDLSTGEVGLLRLSSDAIPRANLPTGTEAKIINPQAHDEGAGSEAYPIK